MKRCRPVFFALLLGTVAAVPAAAGAGPLPAGAVPALTTPSPEPGRRTLLPAPAALPIVREEPRSGTTVAGARPQISATFGQPLDPRTVHIRLDGRDVTEASDVSDRSFSSTPGSDISPGRHRVDVGGITAAGRRVAVSWSFDDIPAAAANFLRNLAPSNGARVGPAFTVRGITRPRAHVHIVATASATLGFGEVARGPAMADVTADGGGAFAHELATGDPGTGLTDVRLESHAPNGGIAVATLRLRT